MPPSHPSRRRAHPALLGVALVSVLLAPACGSDSTGPGGGGGGGNATLSGTVRVAFSATVVPDAVVSVGARSTTTSASGQFELTDLPTGAATVRVNRAGYEETTAEVTLASGPNSHDFSLTIKEFYATTVGQALVPSGSGPIRGAIIALGGPDVSGFVTGGRIVPPDRPAALEEAMQALGASLRSVARQRRMVLLGVSVIGMSNSASNDTQIFTAMANLATASGHPEISDGPVLLFGISNGSREAAGLVSRHPGRAIGLLARIPIEVVSLSAADALAVPTFVIQAADDAVVDNAAVRATFASNRAKNGLWALAVEPGVGHSDASSLGNDATIGWIQDAIARRLPATPGDPLVALAEDSGWLGNQETLEIAAWADYAGDKTQASWLISQAAATTWKTLGTEP